MEYSSTTCMNNDQTFTLTAEQLRTAADIKDRIQQLESQLAALLGGQNTPVTGSQIPVKRRGRPPGSGKTITVAKKNGGKRKMSAEGRARIVAAQKKRWAAVKKKAKS